MKQLLFLLLLFPCLALAQYQGNANQKITLGEQTTADGLVFRGVAYIDTVTATSKITRANKQDTSAYLLLDTVTNLLWHYKIGSNAWTRLNLLPSDTTSFNYVNTYGTQTVNGAKTFTSAVTATRFNPTDNTATGTGMYLPSSNSLGFSTNNQQRMHITSTGSVGIGTIPAVGIGLQMSANSGPSNKVIFIVQNNADAPTVNATSSLEFGVYSNNGSNFVQSNTILGELNYMGQANNAVYNAGKIDVIVGNAGNVARESGHSGSMRFFTKPTTDVLSIERMRINQIGNVGIGLTDPTAKLQIGGFTSALPATSGSAERGAFRIANTSNIAFDFGTVASGLGWMQVSDVSNYASNFPLLLNPNGSEVWIGYTADNGAYRLQVKDSVYVGGNISASAYTTRSDYDLKDEIQNINYGLNEVMQMQPVKYTYKSNGSSQLGFIAQDLGVITPEVVSFEDKMSVYYNALIPILTKAIQEQNALIKALEQRILTLENK